ncbi:WAT1-related protein At1g70260-like [Lotus japonicus]|uniref:WAT1-related protein At1g70260-like n=1 Tax=Lotus japonicus TaxID=34305 RepID=UPI00258E3D5E|nr:WAT1-related protein At1g70260-like [Lotus japonicus]
MEAKIKMMSEVLPFIIMVIMEGCTIGLTIFTKTAITNGMSPFVFIVSTNALATIILFPCSFLSHHKDRKESPPFTFSLFMRFLVLGFTGITMTQTFLYLGLSYSSPILVCAMGHLIPTFNFLISVILRKTKLNLRSSTTQVQLIGIMVSIMGAVLAEFFKGPLIRPSSHHLKHTKQLFVFSSTPEFWVLGGILLAAASFSTAIWNFIQKETVQQYYPEPMKVVSYYCLLGTILSAIVSWIVERDANAWKLKRDMDLILIVLTALFGGVIRPNIQVWFTRMKGPLYVPLFKPFGVAFATTFGVCFFPNSLHYGSVIGAAILGMGYYTVFYGEFKGDDEEENSCDYDESSDSLDKKIPLLQEKMEV